MGRRLILDTNVLIAYERGTMDRSPLDEDELAIASVTVAEYRVGIELADTTDRAARAGPGHSLRSPLPLTSLITLRPRQPITGASWLMSAGPVPRAAPMT